MSSVPRIMRRIVDFPPPDGPDEIHDLPVGDIEADIVDGRMVTIEPLGRHDRAECWPRRSSRRRWGFSATGHACIPRMCRRQVPFAVTPTCRVRPCTTTSTGERTTFNRSPQPLGHVRLGPGRGSSACTPRWSPCSIRGAPSPIPSYRPPVLCPAPTPGRGRDDAYVVESANRPGFGEKSDVEVSLAGRRLIVSGRKEKERLGLLRRRTRSVALYYEARFRATSMRMA